jgi:transposase-like protein
MYEIKLAKYLMKEGITEPQILIELKKYRNNVSERMSEQCARRNAMFLKKRRDLQKKRMDKGFKLSLDYINTKIEKGEL